MTWDKSPWIEGGLRITRAAIAEVERDAIAGYEAEQEACGYIAGPESDPLLCDRAVPIENLAKLLHKRDPVVYFRSPRTFFAFHERTLEAAMREGLGMSSPVKILYHSHLDVGAYLSGTDQAVLSRGQPARSEGGTGMLGPGPAWPLAFLVSSVRRGVSAPHVDDHKLFIWRAGGFEQSTFELV
jgi:proteasome lid subunit RPN8/RPN11